MKKINEKYSYKTTEKEGVITIVIIENDKKVVYVDTTYHPEGVETIIKNITFFNLDFTFKICFGKNCFSYLI